MTDRAGDTWAEVRRVGRWRYDVTICQSEPMPVSWDGPSVFGRRRAERRARHDLRWWLRTHGDPGAPLAVITPEQLR
jgi:hypothetical protein